MLALGDDWLLMTPDGVCTEIRADVDVLMPDPEQGYVVYNHLITRTHAWMWFRQYASEYMAKKHENINYAATILASNFVEGKRPRNYVYGPVIITGIHRSKVDELDANKLMMFGKFTHAQTALTLGGDYDF